MEQVVRMKGDASQYTEQICEAIDKALLFCNLRTHMINKDFIKGEENCNYEKYLLEYINNSSFFLNLSKGSLYEPPLKPNGKYDANSPEYNLDFKLLVSSSFMEARSNLSVSITKVRSGLVLYGKSSGKRAQKSSSICKALRYKTLDDLENVAEGESELIVRKDILAYLDVLKTEKNLLFFLPGIFTDNDDRGVQTCISIVENALTHDLISSFQYRRKYAPGFDTFLATIVYSQIVFFEVDDNDILKHVDEMEISESEVFMKLKEYEI